MVAALSALLTPDPTKHTSYRNVYPKRNGAAFEAKFKRGGVLASLGVRPTPAAAAELVAAEYAYWYGPGWWRHLRPDDRRRHPWRAVRWAAPAVTDPAEPEPRTVSRPPPEPRPDAHPRLFPAGRPRQVFPTEHVVAPRVPVRLPGCRLASGGCEWRAGCPWRPVGYALEVCEWGRPVVVGDHNAGLPSDDWPCRRVVWVWATAAEADAAFVGWRRVILPRRWNLFAPISVWR